VPVVVSHVPSNGMLQVTKPSLPQIDFAAHFVTFPLQFFGIVPALASMFTVCATQLTCCP